ncbi:MAG: Rrf2 family transcriptional regulator [Nitrospirota bacterium]|nr:Rrf2 family transcriptional regulator [Nitrospirota bacterium]
MSCKLSQRVDYGIRAMVEIASAGSQGITGSNISQRSQIPKPFLKQIMATLVKNGFVASSRGPQGKYALLKEPSRITLSEIVAALEGRLSLYDPASPPGPALRALFDQLNKALNSELEKVTLAECIGAIEKDRGEQPLMFYI